LALWGVGVYIGMGGGAVKMADFIRPTVRGLQMPKGVGRMKSAILRRSPMLALSGVGVYFGMGGGA
jgi:hypothetical protein